MNPTLPPRCERWPVPPARDYALFAEPPGATGAGALELVVIGRVIDPRELCLTPAVTGPSSPVPSPRAPSRMSVASGATRCRPISAPPDIHRTR